MFHAHAEVYLPVSYTNALSIKTTSGKIEFLDEYVCSQINIESSIGSISINNRYGRKGKFQEFKR
jgi:DUF4097 and DUF4098 domain-containing protein YvlB